MLRNNLRIISTVVIHISILWVQNTNEKQKKAIIDGKKDLKIILLKNIYIYPFLACLP